MLLKSISKVFYTIGEINMHLAVREITLFHPRWISINCSHKWLTSATVLIRKALIFYFSLITFTCNNYGGRLIKLKANCLRGELSKGRLERIPSNNTKLTD